MLSIIISAIAFVFLLSFLVLLHEFGHFSMARLFGVRVEEFGFGLPPRVLTIFKKAGTIYSLNWIPFGGFVRLQGENGSEGNVQPGDFAAAGFAQRIIILTAGVFMNFLLAIAIFTLGFAFARWIPTYLTFDDMLVAASHGEIQLPEGVLINKVLPGSTAEAAGVPVKSVLIKVDGVSVFVPEQVPSLQQGKREVTYTLLTGPAQDQPRSVVVPIREGRTGIQIEAIEREISAPHRSIVSAFLLSLREVKLMTIQTILGIAALFRSLAQHGTVPQGITGIIGIAELTHASVQQGFMTYLRLVALLSLSLGVLNILPFPALDGGRVLFVFIEMIRRRPANQKFEVMTNTIGFLCLIGLILIITFYDIKRLIL